VIVVWSTIVGGAGRSFVVVVVVVVVRTASGLLEHAMASGDSNRATRSA
jgi:hypothetical protein